ncbi:MAG: bifunctional DNA primase/polymerase [Oligosphaeraceae bacterium]
MDEPRQYLAAGLSVLPADRAAKRPSVASWKEFQRRLPTAAEVDSWFRASGDAVCVVCGKVSGNLECIDFDHCGELFPKWADTLPQELYDRLVIERTPSGGFHVSYRCADEICGNVKLAVGIRDGRRTTLIETRGEGGLVLCAPSRGYALRQGDYGHLPTLTAAERETLLRAAWALNEVQEDEPPTTPAPAETPQPTGFAVRPGDDYNARGDFRALLQRHGWRPLRATADGNERWQRPGKRGDGTSATLKDSSFFVFSSNAAPFEPDRSYTPFMAYALLEHSGDCAEAASALAKDGYGTPAQDTSDIDWGSLVSRGRPAPSAPEGHETQPRDPGELPERLLHVPGFIDEYVDCAMASAPRPNRVISFCSALAFLSYAAGRKIVSDRNTLPNIYLIALANSGVGKDHPRKVAMTLAAETGIAGGLAEDFKSGSGLEDALFLKPAILFQRDEIDTLFKVLKMAKEENSETLMARLLNIYGSSNGSIKLRSLSLPRQELLRMKREMQASGGEDDAAPLVPNPYLTVFGTAVPQFFFEALDRRMLANGMVARCLILDAGRRGPRQRSAFITIPDSLKEAVRTIREYHGDDAGNLSGVTRPSMRLLTATDGANRMLDGIDERNDARYNESVERRDLIPMAFWARATEKTIKLAMLHAISADVTNPLITEEGVAWADEFTRFLTEQALFMAQQYSSENPFDEKCRKIVRYITDAGGSYDHGALLKRSHESRETFQQIMDTLLEAGSVTAEFQATGGRGRKTYRISGK